MSPSPSIPSREYPAKRFHGSAPGATAATARVLEHGVSVVGADGSVSTWAFTELELVRGDGAGEPVQLERRAEPVEVLIVEDRTFLFALRAALPRGTRLRGAGRGASTARVLAGLALGTLALALAAWFWGVPAAAHFAAARVPPEWERKFGEAVVEQLAPASKRVDDPRVVAPLDTLFARLVAADPALAGTKLVVARLDMVNAFAAPGGTVVLTTGLLGAMRSPDEVAAVMAHELQHVALRHPIRGLFQQLSLQVLLAMVAGDQSAWSTGMRTAGELGRLSFSRADETAADDGAVGMLAAAGLPPVAMPEALESITGTAPDRGTVSFLSTHPAPPERLARVRARAAAQGFEPGAPAIEASAWEVLRAATRANTKPPGA